MKEVAVLLLVALMLNGCSSGSSTAAQTAAGGTWQAQMLGGDGAASGFSFLTQFTINSDGSLSVSTFQFLTKGECFPLNGGAVSGSMTLTLNTSTNQVTGPFSFTVVSGGNTLTLAGQVTGTENGTNGTTLAGASVTGTWSLAGDTITGCDDLTGGSFTMMQ